MVVDRRRADPRRRRAGVLQLPPRPGAAGLRRARRSGASTASTAARRRRCRTLTTMTMYWTGQPGAVAFPPEWPTPVLADALEAAGIRQLHAAETEKYPHVTYFLNGGDEHEHRGEVRILVPSPRNVRTYDQAPEMSAAELADRVCEAIDTGGFGFAVSTSRTPTWSATPASSRPSSGPSRRPTPGSAGCSTAVRRAGGIALVTADHGNAEEMLDRRRPAAYRPHHQPGAAGDHRPGRATARRRRSERPRAHDPCPFAVLRSRQK